MKKILVVKSNGEGVEPIVEALEGNYDIYQSTGDWGLMEDFRAMGGFHAIVLGPGWEMSKAVRLIRQMDGDELYSHTARVVVISAEKYEALAALITDGGSIDGVVSMPIDCGVLSAAVTKAIIGRSVGRAAYLRDQQRIASTEEAVQSALKALRRDAVATAVHPAVPDAEAGEENGDSPEDDDDS